MGIKKWLFLIPMLVLLAAACNNQHPAMQQNQQTNNSQQQSTQTPTANQQPTQNSQNLGIVYENQYMKVTVPAGWTAKQANATVYYGSCVNKGNCTTTPKVEPNPAAVNITKGNYILYINTQAAQASGAEGGRFAEIAMGAPSADAVVIDQPSPPCGTSEKFPAMLDHPRVDLYVSSQDKQDYCHVPSGGRTVWYFSYITNASNWYFNYYKNGEPPGFVITMAYNSKNADNLPVKGSTGLNQMLDEMTGIIKTLQIKQQ